MICPSQAFCESAEEFLAGCRTIAEARVSGEQVVIPPTSDAAQCWGAFVVLQDNSRLVDSSGGRIFGACVPQEAKRTELIAVFVRYVQQHPESRHDDFVIVALNALRKTYPCK
jgi:hypothetical protein